MRKIVLWLALLVLVIVGLSCTALVADAGPSSVDDSVFKLSIHTDKNEYAAGEAVSCYATLEYVGEEDSLRIYSSDPLVYFTIQGGRFTGDYAVSDELMTTTFKKNEPVRFDFVKSGGYSADDADAAFWESWYAEPELMLPAGTYTISAKADGFFDEDDYAGSKYTLTAARTIFVTP